MEAPTVHHSFADYMLHPINSCRNKGSKVAMFLASCALFVLSVSFVHIGCYFWNKHKVSHGHGDLPGASAIADVAQATLKPARELPPFSAQVVRSTGVAARRLLEYKIYTEEDLEALTEAQPAVLNITILDLLENHLSLDKLGELLLDEAPLTGSDATRTNDWKKQLTTLVRQWENIPEAERENAWLLIIPDQDQAKTAFPYLPDRSAAMQTLFNEIGTFRNMFLEREDFTSYFPEISGAAAQKQKDLRHVHFADPETGHEV